MNSDPSESDESQTSAVLNRLRTRFLRDWSSGIEPSLEHYWSEAGDSASEEFLRQLILLELDARASVDETISLAILFERYRNLPISASAIHSAFEEWQSMVTTGQGRSDASAVINRVTPIPTEIPTETIDRYEIREKLGQGSFGTVYRAWDPTLQREVALKVPHAHLVSNTEVRERYLREARAVSAIRHPGICPLYEIHDRPDGALLLSLAFIEGETLGSHLGKNAPLANSEAANLCLKIAQAVFQAHQRGVLHRDLKPQNILISADDNHPVVTDFGLARRTESEDATLTQDGAIVGTPAYMSPEQARGEMESLSVATDVYSLGVILYEMLTAQRPFTGKTLKILTEIINESPPRPSALNPNVDPSLEAICLKGMAKNPEERYSDMQQFAEALEDYLQGSASSEVSSEAAITAFYSARQNSRTAPVAVRQSRLKKVWVGVGLVVLVCCLSLFGFFNQGQKTLSSGDSENVRPMTPVSELAGKWRIFSSLLPPEGGRLEILDTGEMKLVLADSVKAESSQWLPNHHHDRAVDGRETFSVSTSLAGTEFETLANSLLAAQPTSNSTFRAGLRESRIEVTCELADPIVVSPVELHQGFRFPGAEFLVLSVKTKIVRGDDLFPITSLGLNKDELWQLHRLDSNHLVGERLRVSSLSGQSESPETLRIAFDQITMIRDSAFRGDPLPPNHWLLTEKRYLKDRENKFLTCAFFPDGQFCVKAESGEVFGGRLGMGGLRMTYRVLELSPDDVKLEILRQLEEGKDARAIPLGAGPPREIWTCRPTAENNPSFSRSDVEVTVETKVIEVRQRTKTTFKQVNGEKVPVELTESYGVEVPIRKTMLLTTTPNPRSSG